MLLTESDDTFILIHVVNAPARNSGHFYAFRIAFL